MTRGKRKGWPEEVFVQISESHVGRAVRTRRWKYSVVAPDRHGGTDPGSDHYVEEFLYDLEADPYELTNLVGRKSHAQASRVLRERLLRRMIAAGEAVPTIKPAPERESSQKRVYPEEAVQ